jgi:hypothetical protein
MRNTKVSQFFRLNSDADKYAQNVNFDLVNYEYLSTCEDEYGQCAETAILNFFGQTAVCMAVTYTGGGIAGALCQIGNEIDLYTDLYSCNNAYGNCTLQEA